MPEQQVATVTATVLTDADHVETEFTLELNGEPAMVLPGETATDDAARADLYRIALLPEPGFRLLDIVCRDPLNERLPADITFENQSIAFAPGVANRVTCTFSLEAQVGVAQPASVTIETLTDPPDRKGTFTFLGVNGSLAGIDISGVDASTLLGLLNGGGSTFGIPLPDLSEFFSGPYEVAANGSRTVELEPGVRSLVLLDAPGDLVPVGIECRDSDGGFVASVGTKSPFDDPHIVTLDLEPGAAVSCIFGARSVPVASITVTPIGSAPGAEGSYVFHQVPGTLDDLFEALSEAMSGPFAGLFPGFAELELEPGMIVGGLEPYPTVLDEAVTIAGLEPGAHTIVLGEAPEGVVVEAISCLGPDGGSIGSVDTTLFGEPRLISLELAPGADVTCEFSVGVAQPARAFPAPLPGKWRAVNKAGRISCDGVSTRLPKSTDHGRIQVKRDGRRIIATGLAEGRRTRIVLDADPDRPGRWGGRLKVTEQGQSITLDYRVDLVDEKHIRGTMSGDFKVGGQSCTLTRNFVLTHQGK